MSDKEVPQDPALRKAKAEEQCRQAVAQEKAEIKAREQLKRRVQYQGVEVSEYALNSHYLGHKGGYLN